MKEKSFMKSLILHIRYPWTAACLLIMWVGLAITCAILDLPSGEIIGLVCGAGGATVVISAMGFAK